MMEDKEKVIISYSNQIGIINVRSLQEYIQKNNISHCYILTNHLPHQNVVDFIKKIDIIEMVISADLNQKIREIQEKHQKDQVKVINLDDFGETNLMRDAV